MPDRAIHTDYGDPGAYVPKLIIELGHRTAEYYRMLCDEGLPPDLAQLLTRDWHAAQLVKWTIVPYVDRYPGSTITEAEHQQITREEVLTWVRPHPSFGG
jgi:hypothetical protein